MIDDFCLELNKYLQRKYLLKRPPAYSNLNNTIYARSSKFELYFRYKPSDEKRLVIVRIGFKKQKKGNGTMLLKFLSEILEIHDIESVFLECVNDNSYSFGIKMGFAEIGNNNMLISSKDLIKNLQLKNDTHHKSANFS